MEAALQKGKPIGTTVTGRLVMASPSGKLSVWPSQGQSKNGMVSGLAKARPMSAFGGKADIVGDGSDVPNDPKPTWQSLITAEAGLPIAAQMK